MKMSYIPFFVHIYCSSAIEPLNIQNDQHVNKYAVDESHNTSAQMFSWR